MFRAVVREFARAEIAPHARDWDQCEQFPCEVVTKMGALGLFGLLVPEDLGGSAADFTTFCTAIEELAAVDSSMAITLSAGVGLGIGPIMAFGSDAQRRRWLPDLAAGRALGAFGLTEASSGSDAGSLRTRAVLDGDEWVIDAVAQTGGLPCRRSLKKRSLFAAARKRARSIDPHNPGCGRAEITPPGESGDSRSRFVAFSFSMSESTIRTAAWRSPTGAMT